MNNIQQIGLDLISNNISENCTIQFKDNWFNFYIDNCGQRGHCIIPYINFGYIIPNNYVIKRVLSFTNQEDEGKEGAVLGVLNLNKCKVLSVKEDSIEFETFTIYLNHNPCSHKAKGYYEKA